MLKQVHTKYRGYRTPNIRLTEEILPNLVHYKENLTQIIYGVHMFDKTHVVMLTEESLIARENGAAMLRCLREMEEVGIEKVRLEVGGQLHSGEQYLIRKLGEEVGGQIHLGRSSGDMEEVSNRIVSRDAILEILLAINELRAALIETAKQHFNTVMPGYTHGQHAQPTTYGHQLLAYVCMLERNFMRLTEVYGRINRSPAGAVILTGSEFPLNRHRIAALLGFDGPMKNTLDAIMSHDYLLENHAAIGFLHSDLIRCAEDLMFWFENELGIIDFPDRFCGTSSIMMQKKNPYCLQEIKGAGAEAIGGLMTAFMVEKDPTGVPVLDRFYSRQALYRSMDTAVRDMKWLAEMIPAIEVRPELMEERAGRWWAQATDVAGALVKEKDIPWRSAHQIVGILVRLAYERNILPKEATTELLDEAAILYFDEPLDLPQEVLNKALDPRTIVNARTLYGGPGPDEVSERLSEYETQFSQDEQFIEDCKGRLTGASQKLEAAIDAILGHMGDVRQ